MRLDLLGYDSFGEYSSDFFLAGNDWNRGTHAVYDRLLTGTPVDFQ